MGERGWPRRARPVVPWRETERQFKARDPRVPVTLPKVNLPEVEDEEEDVCCG